MSPIPENWKLQFASDNASATCPEAWAALERANDPAHAYTPAYGSDPITAEAVEKIREVFETDCDVYFVFNGTAANSLALASICQPYHGVVCHQAAHIDNDEANMPEMLTGGAKLLTLDGPDGKLAPESIEPLFLRGHGIHSAKIRAVSITQSTEYGALYSLDEIRALTALREKHPERDLKFHMDGARFANAMAALGDTPPKAVTWQAGIDVLSFGGTKNGCPGTEALVFFDKTLGHEFAWRRKQAGQLASKMRYLSAPWNGVLKDDAWLKHARHANEHARLLAEQLTEIDGVQLTRPVDTNAVFVSLPEGLGAALLKRGWLFYELPIENAWRLMCSWSTSREVIEALVRDAREILAAADIAG